MSINHIVFEAEVHSLDSMEKETFCQDVSFRLNRTWNEVIRTSKDEEDPFSSMIPPARLGVSSTTVTVILCSTDRTKK